MINPERIPKNKFEKKSNNLPENKKIEDTARLGSFLNEFKRLAEIKHPTTEERIKINSYNILAELILGNPTIMIPSLEKIQTLNPNPNIWESENQNKEERKRIIIGAMLGSDSPPA